MLHRVLCLLLVVSAALGFVPAAPFYPVQQRYRPAQATTVFMNTPLTYNGKKINAKPGSSMMAACKKLGMNVPTNCKKGDCGTCTVNVGGKNIKACVGKVPPAPKLKSVLEKGLPVRKA